MSVADAIFAPLFALVGGDLVETVIYASIAGVGVAIVFSVAILGMTKGIDYAREERRLAALGAGVAGGIALLIFLAVIVAGIYVMAFE